MSDEKLIERREIWKKKRIIREIYGEWASLIIENLKVGGATVELGSGSGLFKEFMPDVISTDTIKADWLDLACDALYLPFKDSSISNIVMMDVLHHMANPVKFLKDAHRVLEKGGRIVVLEPYGSPFSLCVYKLFHEEPYIFKKDYFAHIDNEEKDPWDSNQAIAQLLFFRQLDRFNREFEGKFKIVVKKRLSYLLYPLSGGFGNRSMIPNFMIRPLRLFERLIDPLSPLLAFRCFVVLEKS